MRGVCKHLLQSLAIVAIVALCTALTVWIKGEPDRYQLNELNDRALTLVSVSEGYVSTELVFSQYKGQVLWVDSRSRSQWKSDGVVGSLFISSDPREDLEQLIDDAIESLFNAEGSRTPIVIYCANKGCSDSKIVADKIRELDLQTPVYQLLGGFGAVVKETRIIRRND